MTTIAPVSSLYNNIATTMTKIAPVCSLYNNIATTMTTIAPVSNLYNDNRSCIQPLKQYLYSNLDSEHITFV